MEYDAIVVGAGMAGLTTAAYLCKDGLKVLLCEKEDKIGGLVNSFDYNGFTFDGGIRAIENSGIVFPMLNQLGIDVEFLENTVSIGIEDDVMKFNSKDSLKTYRDFLRRNFPQNTEDVDKIINEIDKIMGYMDVLYGIENPLFKDLKNDKKFVFNEVIPWLFKYLATINKILKLSTPVDEYLEKFTDNQSLIDIIAQHFFKKTPTSFALSYLSLYIDYKYPKGGTGVLPEKIKNYIIEKGGKINTNTKITEINPQIKFLVDENGNKYFYKKMVWTADSKTLYKSINLDLIDDDNMLSEIEGMNTSLSDKVGGDSVLSLYLTLDMDKSYFENICSEHFFYTPEKKGLYSLKEKDIFDGENYSDDKKKIFAWIKKYCELTTFEIASPVMRDSSLAPEGKTGLIISTLIDYSLIKHVYDKNWYSEFKDLVSDYIIDILENSIFSGMKENIIDSFVATPVTIERKTGNSDGAITGWAFTNEEIPAECKMSKVKKSVETPILDIYQAGQWTFTPSGLPISILTGKLAADAVVKN